MEKRLVLAGGGAFALFVVFLIWWNTCVAAYNTPKFEAIDTNETGFLIPLDSDGKDQAAFESVDYLKDRKVATKRVQIPRRFIQTGRMPATGEYMDTVRLVKVNRSPVIREWTQEPASGSTPSDDSIEGTSKDGIRFAFGFTVTAYIPEEETPSFLYWYRGDQLNHVLDAEIRARVQAITTEVCSTHVMDTLRGQQNVITEAIRKDSLPFFKKRGIEITNMGIIGGFHYKNKAVQDAIDRTVQDQQLKVSAEAKRESQIKENETIKLAAEGKATATKIEAEAKGAAIKSVAEARAFEQQQALKDKEFYMFLKQQELESQRLTKWDGHYPQYYFGMGQGGPVPQILMPAPPLPAPKKE